VALCPDSHESSAADYCDMCGIRMDGPAPKSGSSGPAVTAIQPPAPSSAVCPQCGAPGLERFCEACGFATGSVVTVRRSDPASIPVAMPPASTETGVAMRSTTWTAIVRASRSHYDSVMARGVADSKDIEFPADWPERSFRLSGPRLRVGRRSASREVAPEIDLTGPPTDPGVSRLHAILVSQPDGSWAVEDPGSENGTIVNGSEIPVGQPVPLTSGDTICIGAWTAITIVASS
jgi:hypothetical protein